MTLRSVFVCAVLAGAVVSTASSGIAQATASPELRRARRELRRGNPAGAVDAYGAILARAPDDVRARIGRGFAFLHLDDRGGHDAARADFRAAIEARPEPALAALAYYNLGLLEDRLGHGRAAIEAYRQSAALRPTRAARRRATGERECRITVDDAPLRPFPTWPAALAALFDPEFDPPLAATERAARAALCGSTCDRPTLARPYARPNDRDVLAFTVPSAEGAPRIVGPIAVEWRECHCSPELALERDESVAGRSHLVASLIGHHGACDCPEGSACHPGCVFAVRHEAHLFYDRETDRAVAITVTWRDGPEGTLLDDVDGVRAAPPPFLRVDVRADADGVEVRGCGEEVRRRW